MVETINTAVRQIAELLPVGAIGFLACTAMGAIAGLPLGEAAVTFGGVFLVLWPTASLVFIAAEKAAEEVRDAA